MRNQSKDPIFTNGLAVSVKPEPSPTLVANIKEWDIETDSVVATATIKLDAPMRRIVVRGGMERSMRFGIHQEPKQRSASRIRCRQTLTNLVMPIVRLIVIRLIGPCLLELAGGLDMGMATITLTPRYRVTNYRITISLASGCDSIFESENEFRIVLTVADPLTRIVKEWRWNPIQIGGTSGAIGSLEIPFVLEGSIVSRELIVADGYFQVLLNVLEEDPFSDDFLGSLDLSLSAPQDSGTVEGLGEGSCKVRYRYDKELTLVVPLPSFGQTVVVKA
jgi:hypothetical protein